MFRCMRKGVNVGVYQLVKARPRRTKKLKVKKEREDLINFKKGIFNVPVVGVYL